MKLDFYRVQRAKRDYYTIASGVETELPQALKDPIIAAAIAQFRVAELAIAARLDQLSDEVPE